MMEENQSFKTALLGIHRNLGYKRCAIRNQGVSTDYSLNNDETTSYPGEKVTTIISIQQNYIPYGTE